MKHIRGIYFVVLVLLLAACSNSTPVEVLESQIVGGSEATPGQFPWAVTLHLDGNFRCGGSIIRPQWIITAAHCVRDVIDTPGRLSIIAGEHNRAVVEGTEQTRTITKIFFQTGNFADVALIKLATPLTLNTRVKAIGFGATPAINSTATLSGWGQIDYGASGEAPTANILKHYLTTVIGTGPTYVSTMGKAVKKDRYEGACFGDSGGGLVQPNSLSVMKLVGITSTVTKDCKFGLVSFGRPNPTWVNQTILAN